MNEEYESNEVDMNELDGYMGEEEEDNDPDSYENQESIRQSIEEQTAMQEMEAQRMQAMEKQIEERIRREQAEKDKELAEKQKALEERERRLAEQGRNRGERDSSSVTPSAPRVQNQEQQAQANFREFAGEAFRKTSEEDKLGRRSVARMQGNLEQAEQLNERILESIEQMRLVTENAFSVITKMENARSEMRKTTESAIQANETMEAMVNQIKDFFVKDYQSMLNDSNRRLVSSFITQSRDGYLQLFHMAVKNFKQFTESAIKWQQKLESDSGKELKEIAETNRKIPKFVYMIVGLQVVNLVFILYLLFMK